MSDTHTTERPTAHAQPGTQLLDQELDALGHGRHRGEICAEDNEAAPSGRHRRGSERAEAAGSDDSAA
ncbi:hypothetical protein [Streptomyces sp. CRN 30]|uniref:hypothetical protein n=1 Tax=Streptomyces sp. CRN 30 TaxID=3075613 RepID=UPI002A83310C|nr:hypothetical protein [Streptomyces sp. CRN 30]